jgi:hypothetical protein
MNQAIKIGFLFRKPKFPIICDFNGYVMSFMDISTIAKRINDIPLRSGDVYNVVDAAGEGWAFYSEKLLFSPLTVKKRWKKKEIIDLYNNRNNRHNEHRYVLKNPDSKRLSEVIGVIAELLDESNPWY